MQTWSRGRVAAALLLLAVATTRALSAPTFRSAHQGGVYSVAFSPDGRRLVSAADTTVRVWEAASGRPLLRIRAHGGRALAAWFLPDGSLLSVGTVRPGPEPLRRYEARVWEGATGGLAREFPVGTPPYALSPDGALLATAARARASEDRGSVLLVGTASGRVEARLPTSVDALELAFADDGRLAVYGGDIRQCSSGALADCDHIEIWDVSAPRRERRIGVPDADLGALAFSPGGTLLAGGHMEMDNAYLSVWDAATGKLLRHWPGHTARVQSVTFSPDGARLFSGARFGEITAWPLERGGHRLQLSRGASVGGLAVSPDGRLLAHADSHWAASVVRVLAADSGRELWVR